MEMDVRDRKSENEEKNRAKTLAPAIWIITIDGNKLKRFAGISLMIHNLNKVARVSTIKCGWFYSGNWFMGCRVWNQKEFIYKSKIYSSFLL